MRSQATGVFGVANVTKMLHDLPPPHREDCVNSLAYEADARVQDPVYGCVGAISILQQQDFTNLLNPLLWPPTTLNLPTLIALLHQLIRNIKKHQPINNHNPLLHHVRTQGLHVHSTSYGFQ
uniref:LOB domain-containing protein n=1 Tax=Physcomitrium patens TaxID=3218 RepID=A0A2K1L087_PHYPA|nr:hypothetical protein PHYPA_002225 [Physcomitrium patens]